jgi:hypothetical protein
MAAHKQKNSKKVADILPESLRGPQDVKLLTQAIKELNVSRTKAGMYPPDHPEITRSIDRAYSILRKLNETWASLTLGVTKDGLLLAGERLDPRSTVFKDFAVALSRRDIASITLIKGLRQEELHRFHQIMNTDPEEIREAGGVNEMMRHANMNHILIQTVDYRHFHLTEEEEIAQIASKESGGRHVDIWQSFVQHLISGRLAKEGQGTAMDSWGSVDPLQLSQFINEHRFDPNRAIRIYEDIIRSQLGQVCDLQTMEKLNTLLHNLRPELRRQFLSVTFDNVRDGENELLGGFDDELVLEMLQNANDEGREISPTLLALVHELSSVAGPSPVASGQGWSGQSFGDSGTLSPEQFRKLFDRESYESYVDPEYSSTLEHLSGVRGRAGTAYRVSEAESKLPEKQRSSAASNRMADLAPEFQAALDEGQQIIRISGILVSLMGQGVDGEEYEAFAGKLVEYAPELLNSGEFELLLQIVKTLRRHTTSMPTVISGIAEKSLASFTDSYFVSKTAQAFKNCRGRKIQELSAFFMALGSSCVPKLMDMYALQEFPASDRALAGLLMHFREAAVEEAQARLTDPRVHVVRNLLAFIQSNGDRSCIPTVTPLLRHESHHVRSDALSILLSYQDDGILEPLRTALRSKIREESSIAVMLAGLHRVGEVVEDLVRLIKLTVFRRLDHKRNEEILRALGRIGDPKAMPVLEKLAKKSWVLYPSDFLQVKLALFESLSGYPEEHLTTLLTIGRRSKDYRIRNVCSTMQRGN